MVIDSIRSHTHILSDSSADYTPLMSRIGKARLVLIGEASHGTHEFYRTRAEITKRLIVEKGFQAVAVEADWPDASRVNAFVHGPSKDRDANQALGFSSDSRAGCGAIAITTNNID